MFIAIIMPVLILPLSVQVRAAPSLSLSAFGKTGHISSQSAEPLINLVATLSLHTRSRDSFLPAWAMPKVKDASLSRPQIS